MEDEGVLFFINKHRLLTACNRLGRGENGYKIAKKTFNAPLFALTMYDYLKSMEISTHLHAAKPSSY